MAGLIDDVIGIAADLPLAHMIENHARLHRMVGGDNLGALIGDMNYPVPVALAAPPAGGDCF
jgi:hypothetical protein